MSFKVSIAVNQEIENPFDALIGYPLQHRVLSWLLRNCRESNSGSCLQTKIANDVKSNRVSVCKALKELEKKSYIVKDGKENGINRYMINPHYVWTGGEMTHKAALSKWDKSCIITNN
jgi:DNA-binding MarR family transcriptional regulator